MKPFLYQVASLFYQEHGAKISRFAFVFPNKRTGLFFQKYLSELSDKPLFSPAIFTINDLFIRISGKQVADHISMLFSLYKIYTEKSGSPETFDEFLHWGEMLLNDFDDVDKHMADARMLFTNVTDLRRIEADYNFLNEQQITAIRTFWSSFQTEKYSANQQNFLSAWEILYDLYTTLRQQLAAQGKGYEGMIFREVVEKLKLGMEIPLPYPKIIFVGLNALSLVEEELLKELNKREMADFYWDYYSTRVTDPDNRASFFANVNLKQFPSSKDLPKEEVPQTQIEVIGIPSGIGQAKHVTSLLQELCGENGLSDEDAIRTAVVLPDEHLLIPVLNAIPEPIRRINVTMGYPLSGTPVASLMEYILTMQRNIRYVDRVAMFYFRDVLPILNHRYIMASAHDVMAGLVKDITENNKIYIGKKDLDKTPLLSIIFNPVIHSQDFSSYLLDVLKQLNHYMTLPSGQDIKVQTNEESEPEEDMTISMNELEQEFIFHYFATINRMKEVMDQMDISMQFETYFRLIKRITETISIPFHGEPLSGLQIMGILETRALDFDRVIILSMNEGVFPTRKTDNSFIPYNLRRGFGLPTYEHQDSMWAYYFYRLIHRAKHVSLLYDTRNTGTKSGEMSRFIHQLRYHYEEPLVKKLVVYDVSASRSLSLEINKTEEIMQQLAGFMEGGKRALSASAVNTYLDCSLKFYFSVVEGVQEEEEVTEKVESDIFGSILHKVMEDLYQPLQGKMVTVDLLKAIKADTKTLTVTITKAFAEIFFKTDYVRPLTGQNYLIGEMIRKYVEKVLERDGKLTPFIYLESERRISDFFTLSNGTVIQLKGFIDRVDEVNGVVRIIDYKSGAGSTDFKSIDSLFDAEEKDRSKAVMQVFMYAWMYSRLPVGQNKLVRPGIYYMRDLFSPDFDPSIYYKMERGKKMLVEAFNDYAIDFETSLRHCLDHMFDQSVSFTQTTTGKACPYCSFKDICGK